MTNSPTLITAPEAGVILHCSGRTVIRKAERGHITIAQKLPGPNGAYLFDRAGIEALAESLQAAS
jgi:hypothetical protein